MGEDDDALWRKITEGVKPLKGRQARRHPAQERAAPGAKKPAKASEDAPRPRRVIQPGPPPKPKAKPPPPLGHGDVSGVDRRSAERMKRGKLPIEARIDLHGLTQVEAQRALTAFIEASQAAGRRCVLVITGKGGLRGAGGGAGGGGLDGGRLGGREAGVLRQQAPQWLNLPGLREKVLAYDYAQPRDGGQGALYVLLRRRKAEP